MDEVPATETFSPLPPRRWLEIWLPLVVVAADQLTKALVRQMLPLHTSVAVVPGFLDLTHVRNTGAAFGILNTADFPFKTVVIPVIATAALVAVGNPHNLDKREAAQCPGVIRADITCAHQSDFDKLVLFQNCGP